MELQSYRKMDATEMAERIRRKDICAEDMVRCAAEMIHRTQPTLNCVAYFDENKAVEKAKLSHSGIFGGVPFFMKDLAAYPELRCAFGSRIFANNIQSTGSEYTQKIDQSGVITLGNTTVSEFGLLGSTESILYGITRNPWNHRYSAGGSSGGSAASVAAGIVPIAHASDGGGSIRYPASVNGVFGFRPSKWRTVPSMNPDDIFSQMVSDHCITRSVRDSARFLAATERSDNSAVYPPLGMIRPKSIQPMRIGVYSKTLLGKNPDSEILEALHKAMKLCEELGHVIIEADPRNIDGKACSDGFFIMAGSWLLQITQNMEQLFQRPIGDDDLEPFSLELLDWVRSMQPDAQQKALTALNAAGSSFLAFASDYDVLLSPVIAKSPCRIGYLSPKLDRKTLIKRTEDYVGYTPIHNSPGCGMCAMSVPLYVSEEGLPIGSHFAAMPGEDEKLFQLAYQLEAAFPWINRMPL